MFSENLWCYSGKGNFKTCFLELFDVWVITAWLKLFGFIYFGKNVEKEKSVQAPFKYLKFSWQFFLDLVNSLDLIDNDDKQVLLKFTVNVLKEKKYKCSNQYFSMSSNMSRSPEEM